MGLGLWDLMGPPTKKTALPEVHYFLKILLSERLVELSYWSSKWQPTVFLPGKFYGERSLMGYIVSGVAKSRKPLSI